MKPIRLEARVETSSHRVWAELADLRSHSEWMTDAGTIRFLTDQDTGVGTRFEAPSRIGPFWTRDLMTVTEWDEGRLLAVEHRGAVTGIGRFELHPIGEATILRWSEELRFPWWLGGVIGAALARPVLKRVWRSNLERLRRRLEVNDP